MNNNEEQYTSPSSVPLYSEDEELPWKVEELQKAVREKRIIISSVSSDLQSEFKDQFTVYKLIVELQMDTARVRWKLDRRYDQFFTLHTCLKRKFGNNLPTFPSKTIFADKNSELIVNQRVQDLHNYLTELLQKKTEISAVSSELHDFLETRKKIYGHGPIRRRILFPIPASGFDVSQVAVGWKQLNIQPGYVTHFCLIKSNNTNNNNHNNQNNNQNNESEANKEQNGQTGDNNDNNNENEENKANPDPTLSQSAPFVASMLAPTKEARLFYREMEDSDEFQNPIPIEEVNPLQYDAIFLTGGYTTGVNEMVNNSQLQRLIKDFWDSSAFRQNLKVCAAIDRGTLLLAKTVNEETGKSLIHKRKTTTLPKWFEKVGSYLNSSMSSADSSSPSTTPTPAQPSQSCLDQVRGALEDSKNLIGGPISITTKGTWFDDSPAFVVEDGNYLSGRWTGDIYLLSKKLVDKLDHIEIEVRTPKARAR